MTRLPPGIERPPGVPRPVPTLPPREDKLTEDERLIIAEYDQRELQERTLDYDPYA